MGLFTEAAANAREAITLSDEVGDPSQISQARAWWVTVNFNNGQGIDEPSLRRALELKDIANTGDGTASVLTSVSDDPPVVARDPDD